MLTPQTKALRYYGKLHNWLITWLTQRTQQVVIDKQTSTQSRVKSGVPQGTVMGPIMFLLYINDIGQNIRSKIQLFADDCVFYIESFHKMNKLYKKILLKYPTGQTLGIWNSTLINVLSFIVPDYFHTITTSIFTWEPTITKCYWTSFPRSNTFDNKICFSPHIKYISAKATKLLTLLEETWSLKMFKLSEWGSSIWLPITGVINWNECTFIRIILEHVQI